MPLQGLARAAVPRMAEAFVEALDLCLRFLQMDLEQALELRGAGGLRHLRQRLDELLFGMQDIAQLIDQELLDGIRTPPGRSFRRGSAGCRAGRP